MSSHGQTAAEASTSAAEASTSAAEASTSAAEASTSAAAEASTSAAEASTSAAEASTSAEEGPSQVSLRSEKEPVPSTSSQPPTKRPRRRNSVLAFLKKQAAKDEARDAAL
ncbi:hypothetical protein CgunFtcFv8_018171 [Champsocephalus gunnari]|uniref:Uncharacterized protein n=1 Tax=Champsocephalus gunnari TaxID=52237 RepID=A0AAN8DNP5_CHAGU|nr:hypothetical protein CgunFtcFv8_018171 [Champsocephalus gunnari]